MNVIYRVTNKLVNMSLPLNQMRLFVSVDLKSKSYLIDWLIDWCFTPRRQYFSHIVARTCIIFTKSYLISVTFLPFCCFTFHNKVYILYRERPFLIFHSYIFFNFCVYILFSDLFDLSLLYSSLIIFYLYWNVFLYP